MSGSTTSNQRVRKRTVCFSFPITAFAPTACTANLQLLSFCLLLLAIAVAVHQTMHVLSGQKRLPPAVVRAIGIALQSERAARSDMGNRPWQGQPKAKVCCHRCCAKAACRREAHPKTDSTAQTCNVSRLQQQQPHWMQQKQKTGVSTPHSHVESTTSHEDVMT